MYTSDLEGKIFRSALGLALRVYVYDNWWMDRFVKKPPDL